MRSILGQVRPDRQTLLFSATMPRKVERLVTDALAGPVRVAVGELGAANEDVTQVTPVSFLFIETSLSVCSYVSHPGSEGM